MSRVWFTAARGTITEIYFPRVDQANTRDLRLIVTAPDGAFFDEMKDAQTSLAPVAPGVPLFRIRQASPDGRFAWDKLIVTDPLRPVVLMRARLEVRDGVASNARVFALLAPHVQNRGENNDAWVGAYKGLPVLTARRDHTALALGCSAPMLAATCTYTGTSDAWHDLRANGALTNISPHAFDGNLLLAAEIGGGAQGDGFVIALGFGDRFEDAAVAVRGSLMESFDDIVDAYVAGWTERQRRDRAPAPPAGDDVAEMHRTSLAVLRAHEDKDHPGGYIASVGIPWGMAHGDDDRGAYHLMWPRDLVEIAGALLAVGLCDPARLALLRLMSTQEQAGHWPQNMWLDGRAYWQGVQLDEAALPILLAAQLARHDALAGLDPWPMVRRAAGYIVRHGPASPEDRWEEHIAFSPFTLAVEIAALVEAGRMADRAGERHMAHYLLTTAAAWNGDVDRWAYARDTPLARRLGIPGYYARTVTKVDGVEHGVVAIDALALVRFGVRDPGDARMRHTILAIDALLKTETTRGPVWHRFDGDQYGEHPDGTAFDGGGVGRGWPLLVGERAHYEIARGDQDAAIALRRAMIDQAGESGLLSEQIWDTDDIPGAHLFNGRPTGSARPLAWAHAEFIKLCRSLDDGRVFDTPNDLAASLARETDVRVWRTDLGRSELPAGATLRVELLAAGDVQWHVEGRRGTAARAFTTPSGLGTHVVDLPTADLNEGDVLCLRAGGASDVRISLVRPATYENE